MAQEVPGEEQAIDGDAIDDVLSRLDARAAVGDATCALAARVLRRTLASPAFAPDAMAVALDRLVRLVRAQEEQIRALRAMIETGL